jgi:hypothetical protein
MTLWLCASSTLHEARRGRAHIGFDLLLTLRSVSQEGGKLSFTFLSLECGNELLYLYVTVAGYNRYVLL